MKHSNKEEYYADLYLHAVEVATKAHEGQTRWNGEPYITHPITVSNAFDLKTQPREKITAVLHDVLEDSNITSQELMQKFPVEIVEALILLTHRPEDTYTDYIMKISNSNNLANKIAMAVKIADLNHNLSDLNHKKHAQRLDKYQLARQLITSSSINNLVISG